MQYVINSFPRSGSIFFESLLATTLEYENLVWADHLDATASSEVNYIVHIHDAQKIATKMSNARFFSIIRNPLDAIASLMAYKDQEFPDEAIISYKSFMENLIENGKHYEIVDFNVLTKDPVLAFKKLDLCLDKRNVPIIYKSLQERFQSTNKNHVPSDKNLFEIKKLISKETVLLNSLYLEALNR